MTTHSSQVDLGLPLRIPAPMLGTRRCGSQSPEAKAGSSGIRGHRGGAVGHKQSGPLLQGRRPSPTSATRTHRALTTLKRRPGSSTFSRTDPPHFYRHSSPPAAAANSKSDPQRGGDWPPLPAHLPAGANRLVVRVFQINPTAPTSERPEFVEKCPDVTRRW